MNNFTLSLGALAASVALVGSAQAEAVSDNISINGFASLVMGTTLNQGTNKTANKKAVFIADEANGGVYDDDLSFLPDSIYGIQLSADLGEGLSLTGQIIGAGGKDFDAEISWAYLSYAIDDNWTVLAGRQRLPLFFYSDYSDVAYAYHWVRIPTEVNVPVDTLDGIQVRYEGSMGDWDTRVQMYAGASESTSDFLGDFGLKDSLGLVLFASNDWLQLRATLLDSNFYASALESFGQGKSDALAVQFVGLAAHMTFGNAFVVAEVTRSEFDEPIFGSGVETKDAGYVSLGYRMNKFTPHITYSASKADLIAAYDAGGSTPVLIGDATQEQSAVTVGLRWDFHRSAALKAEYTTRSDDSDQIITDISGDKLAVDLFTVGVDVIF